mmetsp:Transcript_84941/g.263849  ORF Transcript_84941/g.263849 Transcript_84941/m.263849 type:complete len:182 (-) Transcript_84941:138-683(-)
MQQMQQPMAAYGGQPYPQGQQPMGGQMAMQQQLGQMPMQQQQQQGRMLMQQQLGPMAMQQPPGAMVMQQPGQMAMQTCPQVMMQCMPMEAAPQLSPWARVLNHFESKGIAFADIKACHLDTRRDILKEVFPREPLARAQAEMDWMKAKSQAIGTTAQRRTRSRSRDRISQGAGGVSYVMRR